MSDPREDRSDALQRRLAAQLAGVRRRLGAAEDAVETAAAGDTPLDHLAACFGLSPFERDILLIAAGAELDSRIADRLAKAHGDEHKPWLTFGLALAVGVEPCWDALAPAAPLRHWRLVELGSGSALTTAPLRLAERVLHFIAGVGTPDETFAATLDRVPPGEALPARHGVAADTVVRHWRGDSLLPVQLAGPDRLARRAAAAAAAQDAGLTLWRLPPEAVPAAPAERTAFRILCERECLLGPAALLVETDAADATQVRLLTEFVERFRGPAVVSAAAPVHLERPSHVVIVGPLTRSEQRAEWLRGLGGHAASLNGHVDRLLDQFDLDAAAIRTVTHGVAAQEDNLADELWNRCRRVVRPRLEDLAERIDGRRTWADLVLPESQAAVLREILGQLRHRRRVHDDWGFADGSRRGLGLCALFAGPSGTGKTLAAEVLAAEAGLDLFRIDLSQVVSKYIGETEKHLKRVFDAAECGSAILLFDEADALFGKRTEVKDSHDRHANVEVSYLLQRMECYRGLAILTTNMRAALDSAFLRRLRFAVEFPVPDAVQRARIWRGVFPPQAATEGLDPDRLARLAATGGVIRTIALNAAFLAADAGEPIRMGHLRRAAVGEYVKQERPLSEAEIGGWT